MVTRRGFTTAIGALGSVGAAYWFVTDTPDVDVDVDVGAIVNDSKEAAEDALSDEPDDPWDQTFNSDIVERIRFDEDGTMFVTMTDTHGLDAFGIWHASDDINSRGSIATYGTGVFTGILPRYGGTVNLNLASELKQESSSFPSNKFKLVGITGNQFIYDVEGVVRFFVPETLMP